MSESGRIADQLRRSVIGLAWHGPALLELLADVTPEQAAAHPAAGAHSIWEIVAHVTVWTAEVNRRLDGNVLEMERDPESDWPAIGDVSEEAWRAAVHELKSVERTLWRRVRELPDAQLDSVVPIKDYPVYYMLHGLVQHNLYHAGQIALLRKMRG